MAKAVPGSKALVLLTIVQNARTVTVFCRSKRYSALSYSESQKHTTASVHDFSDP